MKAFLITTAFLEIGIGLALLAVPALLTPLLLGGQLDTSVGLVVARVAGAALLSLGVACWNGSRDVQSGAARGIVAAMSFYNIGAVAVLSSARFCLGLTGIGLFPAAALHAALAVWCVVCLLAARGGASISYQSGAR